MTSNIGSQMILNLHKRGSFGFGEDHGKSKKNNDKSVRDKIMELLQENFKPEFLNRVDDIIMFQSLAPKEIEQIVDLQLAKIAERIIEKKITLNVEPSAKKLLAKEGYNEDYGARPLKRALQNKLLDELALQMITGTIIEGDTVKVTAEKDKIVLKK